MASIVRESGKFRAYICIAGQRESQSFTHKRQAENWAQERSTELRKLLRVKKDRSALFDDSYTVGQLFERYEREVSPGKRGERWEVLRLRGFRKHYPGLCVIPLIDIVREDIEEWIDARLHPDPSSGRQAVKTSSVNRELNLIGHCFTTARRWRLMHHHPFEDLERPVNPEHRKRLIEPHEKDEMLAALNYQDKGVLTEKRQWVALMWLLAIETCMRMGEILSLTPTTINLNDSTAYLPNTKNGSPRHVPLSPKAISLLGQVPKPRNPNSRLFSLSTEQASALFRKYRREKTSIQDMVFHDSRHQGITQLVDSGKHVCEVSLISGHKDIKQLMTYYNKSAKQIAKEMAEPIPKSSGSVQDLLTLGNVGQLEGLTELVKLVVQEQAKMKV